MYKITKELCKTYAEPLPLGCAIFVFAILFVFIVVDFFIQIGCKAALIAAIISVVLFTFLILLIRKNINQQKYGKIYLMEDVFIGIERKTKLRNQLKFYYEYFAKFVYRFTMDRNLSEPDEQKEDYFVAAASEPADKFFLLMQERNGKEDRIVKCFNKRFYSLNAEDFVFTDGVYRVKQHKG